MKKIIITIILALLIPIEILAAPAVSGVSGTVSNGESITISGTGFGATGPSILVFDDFELGSNGTNLSDQLRNAQIGTWRDISGLSPYFATYSNLNAHSGSLAMRNNWGSEGDNQEGARFISPTSGSMFSDIYFSFWTFLPTGQNVPSGGIGPNWKVWWLSVDDYFQNDYASEIVTDPPSETSICYVDGSTSRACWGYGAFNFTKGRWLRWEAYLHGATDNTGIAYLWFTDSGNTRSLVGSATNDNTLDGGTTGWQQIHFPGFGRYDTNSNTYYDDIYVATGSGARARVEICNNATYSSATNCAVSTPTSWADTSIAATVRAGSFTTGTAYIFVVHADGTASSGYEITLGEGGGDTTDPVVTADDATKAISTDSYTAEGDASDAVGVTGCTWKIGAGSPSACTGTTSWSCATSGYASGANTLTITCSDAASNEGSDTVTVTYTPAAPSPAGLTGCQIIGGTIQ